MRIKPQRPNGVLYDADGRIVYRFGGFQPGHAVTVPDYVDPTRDPIYTATEKPGSEGYEIEADPERDDLPDPTFPNLAALSEPDIAEGLVVAGLSGVADE